LGQLFEPLFVDQQVHHQPGFVKAQVFQRQAHLAAHKARCAVAADDVARLHLAAAALRVLHRQRGGLAVLGDSGDGVAERHGDVGQAAHMGAQGLFHRGLAEHQRGRIGQWVGLGDGGHALDELAVDPKELGIGEGFGEGRDGVDQIQLLKHPHDLVVQGNGTGLVIHVL